MNEKENKNNSECDRKANGKTCHGMMEAVEEPASSVLMRLHVHASKLYYYPRKLLYRNIISFSFS
jgi:hypothetical protein